MRRTGWRKGVAVVMSALVLLSAVSVTPAIGAYGAEAETIQQRTLKGIFDRLLEHKKYKELKGLYGEQATLSEQYQTKADGTAEILFSLKAKEGYEEWIPKQEASFGIDADQYVVCVLEENNPKTLFAALLLDCVCGAIADYYGMDENLVTRYLTAVPAMAEKPTQFQTKYYAVTSDDTMHTITMKIYAGGVWDKNEMLQLLGKVYFTEKYLQDSSIFEPLTGDDHSSLSHLGNFAVYLQGNRYSFTMTLAEYGQFDENGATSIRNIVKAVKPKGYEKFDYKGGLEEHKDNLWSVRKVEGEEIPEALKTLTGTYEFVQVRFTSPYISGIDSSLTAGDFRGLFVENGTVKKWTSSNPKVAVVSKDGMVTALKKGTVTVTAFLSDGTRLTGKVKVTSSPYIKVSGKKLVASKTYKIKCNKTLKVSLKGKAFSVKNKYKSTKKSVARVISGKDENILKIRGYKKGTAKVSITCNGVTFKIKVKVV